MNKKFDVTVEVKKGRHVEYFSNVFRAQTEDGAKNAAILWAKANMEHRAVGYNSKPEDWTYTATVSE